jgi:hypothetical protein
MAIQALSEKLTKWHFLIHTSFMLKYSKTAVWYAYLKPVLKITGLSETIEKYTINWKL